MAKQTARRTRKARRNMLVRIVRGAHKMGNPLPGRSRVYDNANLSPAYESHGASLRDDVDTYVLRYWGDEHIATKPRSITTNRWF